MLNENFSFKLLKEEKCARVGKIYTHRGHIDTPTFMTVGTQGTIKQLLLMILFLLEGRSFYLTHII